MTKDEAKAIMENHWKTSARHKKVVLIFAPLVGEGRPYYNEEPDAHDVQICRPARPGKGRFAVIERNFR